MGEPDKEHPYGCCDMCGLHLTSSDDGGIAADNFGYSRLCILCHRNIVEDVKKSEANACTHECVVVEFDEIAAKGLDEHEVRKRWPRFFGKCPDCGTQLIKYASYAHYAHGDW